MRPIVVAALTSQLIPDIAPMPGAAWRAIKRLPEAEILPTARLKLPGVDAELIRKRLDRLEEYESHISRLSEIGISLVTEFEPDFPQLWLHKLGDRTASHLFVAGNLSLLNMPAIGVVGSREADSLGMGFCRTLAKEANRLGYIVISGGAKGVDETAMQACIEAGGSTVGILAESLVKRMKKWDIDSGKVCLATPLAPDIGFQVGNAMARNKLIYAGSNATVVVSSALESGGTWAGATEAIRQSLCPVLVRDAKLDGNQALVKLGGTKIGRAEELDTLLKSTTPTQGSLL